MGFFTVASEGTNHAIEKIACSKGVHVKVVRTSSVKDAAQMALMGLAALGLAEVYAARAATTAVLPVIVLPPDFQDGGGGEHQF